MSGQRLILDHVSVDRGGRRIVNDVCATIEPGKLTVLIGPNGAGKSTLLRAASGLIPLAGGRVGGLGSDQRERARRLAWVPDTSDMPFAFTVLDTVLMGRFAIHEGAPGKADRDAAHAALARLGVDGLASRTLATLSSGERQKAHVARALASDAACLLLDEPCASLDIGATLHLLAILKDLTTGGKTVVLTLHDLAMAHRFAEFALCIAGGTLLAAGTPSAAFAPDVLKKAFGVRAKVARTDDGEATLRFD